MATLTKKDLLEAIEDMPMDAEIKEAWFNIPKTRYKTRYFDEILCFKESNEIFFVC